MPESEASPPGARSVLLEGVRVRYQVVEDRVTSFKEFVLETLRSGVKSRELLALDGIDLVVQAGEMVGVVGRNGAGKTTLLKVAAGVLTPTEGRVRTEGRVVPLLGVGAGFQPDLTGRENAFLALAMLGTPRRHATELFEKAVGFSELRDVIDRPIRQYSAGMVARLGFAVGTAERADVLLLDEVLAVGDERFQEKCLRRIGDFCTAGTTVLLVSHSAPAISHCQRAVWIRAGRVECDGPPGEVLADYRREGSTERGSFIAIPENETPSRVTPDPSPVIEPIADDDLMSILRRRCGDPGSPFHAVRVYAELRDIGLRLGVDFARVLEIGPSSSALLLACFAAAGSNRVASTGSGSFATADELRLLKSYLGPVCGAKWWRYAADVYSGGALEAPGCWNDVDIDSRASIVERLPALGSGRIPVADNTFTFLYSTGSLSRVTGPEVTIQESARVLASGGGAVHEIVFADLNRSNPLADLQHSEEEWRRLLLERGRAGKFAEASYAGRCESGYGHRWRVSDFVAVMERVGFEQIAVEPIIRLRRDEIDRDTLAEPFRSRSMEDLEVLAAHVCGRKP